MADKAIVAVANTAVTSERLAEFWASHEGSTCSIDTQILTIGLGTIVKATVKAGAYSITAHSETVVVNVQIDTHSIHNAELQAIERAMALFPVRG
jgi:hypothetical protein